MPAASYQHGSFQCIRRNSVLVLMLGVLVVMPAVSQESSAQEVSDDRRSLSSLFGESLTPDALEVYRLSRQMPIQKRYEYLRKCVLPAHSNRIRLSIDYLPTNPSPPVLEKYGARESPAILDETDQRTSSGGVIVSPAIELVESARQMGELGVLQELIAQRTSSEIEQLKSQLALQIMIAWADEGFDIASQGLTRFVSVVRESPDSDLERQPEMAVLWSSLNDPESMDQVYDLLHIVHGYGIVDQTHSDLSLRNRLFKIHLSWVKSQIDDRLNQEAQEKTQPVADSSPESWIPVSRRTARTEGMGYPTALWIRRGPSVHKIAPHDLDFLYYSVPLRGEFEIEGGLSTFSYRDVRLGLGNYWIGPVFSLDECEQGTFHRQTENVVLDQPLLEMNEFMRVRIEARAGKQSFFINGREISCRPYGPSSDPWVSIISPWYSSSVVENLRITGSPEIPAEIDLLLDPELPGWLPYFHESEAGTTCGWQIESDESSSNNILIGRVNEELHGSHQESLLRYCRPMLEDGVIEYEFYYEEGRSSVYPALGRCCFLFDRSRAGIHWLTDGKFDRTGEHPANFTEIATIRAESNPLPLIPNDWNRTRLTLRGNTVAIALNGKTILKWELNSENLKAFGLFHYSDRTESRVRKLHWRGEWPQELPQPHEQELADYSLEDELADGPELPVVFEHDFSTGLPSNKIWGGGREGWHFHKQELPTGVRISKRGGWYSHHTLSFPIQVEGDFDITLAYDDLQSDVFPGGEGDIQLEVIFDDDILSDFRLYRKHHHRKNDKHEQIVEVGLFQQMENNEHRDWPNHYTEESNAGTMRIVRRGDQLFLLHAIHGSPHYRLVHRRQVTTAPIRFGGVKAIVETHLDTEVSVIWKQLTVRSEHPTKFSERGSLTVEKLDEQRAALPQAERFTFTPQMSATQFTTWGTPSHILREKDGWVLKEPGSESWTTCGFQFQGGVTGDYDLTFELEVLKLEEPIGDRETFFSLINWITTRDNYYRDAEFKIASTSYGKRELIIQQNTRRRNGSTRYEKIKTQPFTNVTHLRLARRGNVLYFLYRPGGDAKDRMLGYLLASTDDMPAGFLRVLCRTGGAGKETIIKVKSLDVRAEGMINITTDP